MRNIISLNPARIGHIQIIKAGQIVKNGGVIIFPTDTVYGLGCAAGNKKGIERIYRLKKRAGHKPLPVLIGSAAETVRLGANIGRPAKTLIRAFWPGPLTLIVRTGAGKTLGLRIPDHKIALALLKVTGPMAVTSVNISGCPSARKISEVPSSLLRAVDLVIDGGTCPLQVESTVVDATGPAIEIKRPGYLSPQKIAKVVNHVS